MEGMTYRAKGLIVGMMFNFWRDVSISQEDESDEPYNSSVRAAVSFYCREISYAATLKFLFYIMSFIIHVCHSSSNIMLFGVSYSKHKNKSLVSQNYQYVFFLFLVPPLLHRSLYSNIILQNNDVASVQQTQT